MIGAITAGLFSDAGAPTSTNSFESIATVTVGSGGQSSISFSSIPSTYKHLQIRVLARSDRAVTWEGAWVCLNGDTAGTLYTRHLIDGDGATATASATVPTSGGTVPTNTPGASTTANVFGAGVVDILDYTDTNKYKTLRLLTGFDANGSGDLRFISGLWRNTNAVSSIVLNTQGGGSFVQYSSFALYGVRG